ncbi:hypothetical protein BaRGS_00036967, partial [Batillaria attramentaria]
PNDWYHPYFIITMAEQDPESKARRDKKLPPLVGGESWRLQREDFVYGKYVFAA